MRKRNLRLTAIGIGMLITPVPIAYAQYTGPTTGNTTTVSEVLKNGKDDQYVRLIGVIKEQIAKDKFTFTDQTGEIRVEIDKDVFNAPISDTTKVEIRGEIEKDFMETPEIDVETIIIQQ